jgi:Uma2 family endonuclease
MVHVGCSVDDECLHLPMRAVRFPVELRTPAGFRADDLATWPKVDGRIEFVAGRIQYMPPCADIQQEICIDLGAVLSAWARAHPGFVVGGNEAGMILAGDVRAADAAIWRRADTGRAVGRLRRTPPVLAVEVAGQEEAEPELREKARWYLEAGVEVVWIVLHDKREVVVLSRKGESRHGRSDRLPEAPSLPGLAPEVSAFFYQLDWSG